MKQRYNLGSFTLAHVGFVVLAVGMVTGWGSWLLSTRSADETQGELRAQIATLAQSQAQLLSERSQAQASMVELAKLRDQVASLRDEYNTLAQNRDKAQAEFAAAQSGLSAIVGKFNRAQADVSETGSTKAEFTQPQEVVTASAQKALTKLGYGPLTADGVMGPNTTRAIEEFQYKNGLPVTRELDPPTLGRLTGSADATPSR
jgi:septal ring factor EnvC (AmiA/AmiB activator)